MSDQPETTSETPDRRKQKEARSALERYLTRLRKVCGSIETAEEWAEVTAELNNLLGSYRLEIPPVNLGRLEGAARLAEVSKAGVDSACQTLQLEVEKAIDALPKSGGCGCSCLGSGILGVLIAAAAVIGLLFAAVVVFLRPVEINLANQGCDELPVLLSLPLVFQPAVSLLGAQLPETVPSNQERVIILRSVPVTFRVDGTSGQSVRVSVLGAEVDYAISGTLSDVRVNGASALAQPVDLVVRARDRHEVVVVCN